MIRLLPTAENVVRIAPSSGKGFANNFNGIIVTDYHVIEDNKSIKIKGINGDFNKSYNANLLCNNKHTDLALLQISDYSFTLISKIPFAIKTKLADVGESIFVLGYPYRATMGDEI